MFYLGLVVFDTTKEELIVMAERKTLLLKDDDVSKSITLKKLNIINYLTWAQAMKIFLPGK